jgi:hypothetical protein
MRKGIDERGPIAAWLIRSRALFREPGAAKSWTADEFLSALQAESGWAPTRTTYARWESGAVRPEEPNLDRVVGFYAARGVPGPDVPPAPAAPPDLATVLMALVKELEESRLERVATDARLRAVESELESLRARPAGAGSSEQSAPRV